MEINRAQQRMATRIYWSARNRGELVLKEECAACGRRPPEVGDLHGHHHLGYEFPLIVQTLCPACHAKIHPNGSFAQMSPERRREIARMGAAGLLASTTFEQRSEMRTRLPLERRREIGRMGGQASIASMTVLQQRRRARKGNCARRHEPGCSCWDFEVCEGMVWT